VQRADGEALIEFASPALLFAKPRANSPERTGESETTGDDFHRPSRVATRDVPGEARDVEIRGTTHRAWRFTFAGMIGQQEFEGDFARLADILRRGVHHHAFRHGHRASGRQSAMPLDLHGADEA
jgi:hypothetical protein